MSVIRERGKGFQLRRSFSSKGPERERGSDSDRARGFPAQFFFENLPFNSRCRCGSSCHVPVLLAPGELLVGVHSSQEVRECKLCCGRPHNCTIHYPLSAFSLRFLGLLLAFFWPCLVDLGNTPRPVFEFEAFPFIPHPSTTPTTTTTISSLLTPLILQDPGSFP